MTNYKTVAQDCRLLCIWHLRQEQRLPRILVLAVTSCNRNLIVAERTKVDLSKQCIFLSKRTGRTWRPTLFPRITHSSYASTWASPQECWGPSDFPALRKEKLGKSVNQSSLLTFGNPQLQGVQRPQSFVIGLCVRTTLPESLFNLTEIISVQSIHSPAARFEGKQIPHPRVWCLQGFVPKFIPDKFLGAKLFSE